MSLDKIGPGSNVPEVINVIIEIPAHSDPVKYEIDKESMKEWRSRNRSYEDDYSEESNP